jgi:hypothetical protein
VVHLPPRLSGRSDGALRDAENEAEEHVEDGQPDAAEYEPHDVAEVAERFVAARAIDHDAAKWPQGVTAEFERSDAERDANNCEAVRNAGEVGDRQPKPGDEESEQVVEELHGRLGRESIRLGAWTDASPPS